MKNYSFDIGGFEEIEKMFLFGKISHYIAIARNEKELDEHCRPHKNKVSNYLELLFDDIKDYGADLDSWHKFNPPKLEHVQKILDFSKTLKDDDFLIISCAAGISRSTATALIVMISTGHTYGEALYRLESIRPQAYPNPYMLRLADILLNKNGRLLRYYVEKIGYRPYSLKPLVEIK